MSWGIVSPAVIVGWALLLWVLERRFPYDPEAHRWHHAIDPDAHDLNFATRLALWDRLFGIAFPRGYLRQHLFAFRPAGRAAG